jgi:hypothetical protein
MRAREIFEQSEASPDDVHEIVEAFEEEVHEHNVCNEVYTEHNGSYIHLFLGGYPEDGFSEDVGRKMAAALHDKVEPLGWFVSKCDFKLYDDFFDDGDPEGASSQIMCFIDIFPLHGEAAELDVEKVYHVCRPEDVAGILQHGLQPRTGGNDHIQTKNGRVYVCTHRDQLGRIELDFERLRNWYDLELLEIDLRAIPDHKWYDDVEMSGASVWTPEVIPPTAISHLGNLKDWTY